MKNKIVPTIIFLVVAIALIAIIVFATKGSSYDTSNTSASHETTNPHATSTDNSISGATTGPTAGQYTLADVAKHADATSCWTTINDGVYDVTTWIGQHPGGAQAILGLCGKDGSAAFNGQHGGQARPESELATFKIGVLVQ